MDLDELLALYESSTSEMDQTWRELVVAAAGLGGALARFDNARKAYGDARRAAG